MNYGAPHAGCDPECEGCGCGNPGAMPPCVHCTDHDPDVPWEPYDYYTDLLVMLFRQRVLFDIADGVL